MSERDLDSDLRRHFATLRAEDARKTPAFGEMLANAQRRTQDRVAVPPLARWSQKRTWAVAGPLIAAASFAAVWFLPRRAADREFERVVAEWSRTTQHSSPTDQLLSFPGAEMLGQFPTFAAPQR